MVVFPAVVAQFVPELVAPDQYYFEQPEVW